MNLRKKNLMSSNCRDNHMKCMQRDLDWDMCSRCKQVEDILDYLGKKKTFYKLFATDSE